MRFSPKPYLHTHTFRVIFTMQGRNWLFTINNPAGDGDDPAHWSRDRIKYCVWQLEIAPETGTEHIQGYIMLSSNARLSYLKNTFNARAHWERRRGTHQEADDYCSKEDTRKEGTETQRFGEPPARGRRTDLEDVKKFIDEGASRKEVADEHFGTWCKYYKAFDAYRKLNTETRTWHTRCLVLWGISGSGKSHLAREIAGPDHYTLPPQTGMVWWDGYEGQQTVIIDEFTGWLTREKLQTLVDCTSTTVPLKGTHREFLSKLIILTSNREPASWWRDGLGAMERRLTTDPTTGLQLGLSILWETRGQDRSPIMRFIRSFGLVSPLINNIAEQPANEEDI